MPMISMVKQYWDLQELHVPVQNALRTIATGVKLDELPVLVGKRDLASQGKER
jgi:hypothetical protein